MRQSIHTLLDLIKTFIAFRFLRHMEEDVHLTSAQFIGTSYLNPLNLSSFLNYSKVAFVNSCILLTRDVNQDLFRQDQDQDQDLRQQDQDQDQDLRQQDQDQDQDIGWQDQDQDQDIG